MSIHNILAGALGLPESATDTELATKLAEKMAPSVPAAVRVPKLADTPAGRFHQLAELRARVEGCSLAEAYSRQSESTPELWADVRNAQPRY